jgi:hypothetical protein
MWDESCWIEMEKLKVEEKIADPLYLRVDLKSE